MRFTKYTTIIKIAWQRALEYRFSVYAYRVGEIIENLALILMWLIIYGSGTSTVKGFTMNEMITYLLVGNLIDVIVRNWLSDVVASDIKDGKLSMFLIKPMQYFQYIVVRELGRISFAFLMSVLSNALVLIFFKKHFIWIFNWSYALVLILMIILAFVSELLVSYLIGMVAFWTLEVTGIFYTMERVRKFLSGTYFPISLLPSAFVRLSLLFPFAYSYFVPAQLYLGRIDLRAGITGLGIQLTWIIILYGIIKVVWRRGILKFEGVGI